jgi:hypothetical protein
MKRSILITLIIAIVLCVGGIVTIRIGDSMSTTVPAPGNDGAVMVQDSPLMPLGGLISLIGGLILLVALIWFLVDYLRNRKKKEMDIGE